MLGGGISSLAFLHFLNGEGIVFEKSPTLGGLCRSFKDEDGIAWDIGPRTFSKIKKFWIL